MLSWNCPFVLNLDKLAEMTKSCKTLPLTVKLNVRLLYREWLIQQEENLKVVMPHGKSLGYQVIPKVKLDLQKFKNYSAKKLLKEIIK